MSKRITLPSDGDRTGRNLGAEELALLREVIESGTLNSTKGTHVKAFERAFAARHGLPYARAVTSGTAAIHTAVAAIDPEPADEIITSPVTDMGAIAPILYQQAIPIFADVDPISLNVTPESVAARISDRTRAIIVTHLFGNPCDVAGITAVAAARGIPVIEDCAQALLAKQDGKLVGTIGTFGVFSFQQTKHITTGEGGIVITADAVHARRMRLFADKGWSYDEPNPDHHFLALNYRMTELQGAVARAQLRKLTSIVSRRRRRAQRLTELLSDTPGITLPEPLSGATHVYWKYPLIVDPIVISGGADALGAALQQLGIGCAPRYIRKPAFQCRVFADRKTYGRSRCPYSCRMRYGNSEVVYDPAEYPGTQRGLARVVVLPWNEAYTDEHIAFLATAIREAVARLAQPPAVPIGGNGQRQPLM
jgi:dTDP-4-amino-4,6-dideoxygalactose transaminase